MKRCTIVLCALTAVALAPASASAARFEGQCSFAGKLTSSPGLTLTGGYPMNYKVAAQRMTCAGTLDGAALPAGQRVDLEITDAAPASCQSVSSLLAAGKLRFVRGIPEAERPGGNPRTDPSGDDRTVDPSGDNEVSEDGTVIDPSGDDYLEDPSGDDVIDPEDALQTFTVVTQSVATEFVLAFYSGTEVLATGTATFRDAAAAALGACAAGGLKEVALTGGFSTI